MRFKNGSALVDYVIPTAVIGAVVGFGLYSLASSGTMSRFLATSLDLNINPKTGAAQISGFNNNSITAGSLGGSPDNPVTKCIANNCSIDFGDFVLNNVPDNFASTVETNGNAGGTEELLSMLEQFVMQMEADPDTTPEEIAALKNLLARGYEVVAIERQFETIYPQYKEQYDKLNNYLDKNYDETDNTYDIGYPIGSLQFINSNGQITKIEEGLKTISFKNGEDSYEAKLSLDNINALLDPNISLNYKDGIFADTTNSLGLESNFNNIVFGDNAISKIDEISGQAMSPMGQYLKELSKLNSGKDLPEPVQRIVNALSEEIFDLADNVKQKTVYTNETKKQVGSTAEQIINLLNAGISGKVDTGELKSFTNPYKNVTDLTNSPATETDIDLKIICRSKDGTIDPVTNKCNK